MLHIPHGSLSNWSLSSSNIPDRLAWIFRIVALGYILQQLKATKYLLAFTFAIAIAALLFTKSPSLDAFYTSTGIILHIVGFIFVVLCICTARNKALLFVALSLLVVTATHLIMVLGLFDQFFGVASRIETGWVLSSLFAVFGFRLFKTSGTFKDDFTDWVHPLKSIRSKSAFSLMIASTITTMIAYTVACISAASPFSLPVFCTLLIMVITAFAVFSNLCCRYIYRDLTHLENVTEALMAEDEAMINVVATNNDPPLFYEVTNYEKLLKKHAQNLQFRIAVERQMRRLSQQIAHNLISPLNALNFQFKSLPTTKKQRALINKLYSRIVEMGNGLLAKYSDYHTTGKILDDETKQENLAELINEVVELSQPTLTAYKVKCQANIKDNSLATLLNASHFKCVLTNLIYNAIEAIGKTGNKGLIKISLSKWNNCARLVIQDNGCGMPKELLAQLGKQELVGTNGHGIGLYYTLNRLKAWQAKYSIKTAPSGTAFFINLPIAV